MSLRKLLASGAKPYKPAPCYVLDRANITPDRARFMLPQNDGYQAITWRQFARMLTEQGGFLKTQDLALGDRAAIFAPNRVEWMAAALGIQSAGGVMVPIYGSSTAEQAAYIIEHSEAKVLYVDTAPMLERVLSVWDRLRCVQRVVCLDDRLDVFGAAQEVERKLGHRPSDADLERKIISWSRASAEGEAAEAQLNPEALPLNATTLMLYTSGTTGNPKAVPLTHINLMHNTLDWFEALEPLLKEDAKDLLWLPMSHIFGYGEVNIGNILGYTSYLSSPATVLQDMPKVAPNVFMSVPAYWEKIAAGAEGDPEKLRTQTGPNLSFCLSGGAGLKREVKELFQQAGMVIIEGYGLTETSPTLTLNRPNDFRFDSVGKPLSSVQLKLAEDGEILAKGPNVFGGYFKNPGATADSFTEDGWFKTGDVGRILEDGFLQIIDRKKDILVTAGGKNIPPANIELRFKDDPLIEHLVVYGDSKRYLVAGVWVTPELEAQDLEAKVQARIDTVNAQLARHETIKRFKIMERPLTVEGGFLTATLKLKRKKVYEAFGARLESLYA